MKFVIPLLHFALVVAVALMFVKRENFDDPKRADVPLSSKKGKRKGKRKGRGNGRPSLVSGQALDAEIAKLPADVRAKVQAHKQFNDSLEKEYQKTIDDYIAKNASPEVKKLFEIDSLGGGRKGTRRQGQFPDGTPEEHMRQYFEIRDKAIKATKKCRPNMWYGNDFDPAKYQYVLREETKPGSNVWYCPRVPPENAQARDTDCGWGDGDNARRQCLVVTETKIPLSDGGYYWLADAKPV